MRKEWIYFSKTDKGWFFGLKLHILGRVDRQNSSLLVVTPANLDGRAPAPDLLIAADGVITIGNLGYCCEEFQDLPIE